MKDCIYDATDVYMVDLSAMDKYYGKLGPGNVIVVDCSLEKYCKTKFMKCKKVTFKISGISYICEGHPPSSELSRLGASLSKKKFCEYKKHG